MPFATGQLEAPEFSFLFGLRFGLYLERLELAVEVSPMTYVALADTIGKPHLQVNGTIGGLIPLGDRFSFPLRLGAGFVTVNTNDLVLFQTRIDLLGLAIQVDHAVIEIDLPSFRFATEFDQIGVFSWVSGIGVVYAF
jgi:hypothetical protein